MIHRIGQKGGGAFLIVCAVTAAAMNPVSDAAIIAEFLVGAYIVYLLWPEYRGFLFSI